MVMDETFGVNCGGGGGVTEAVEAASMEDVTRSPAHGGGTGRAPCNVGQHTIHVKSDTPYVRGKHA